MSARLIVRILIVFIAISLFAYTSVRASLLSFTHDESFTYLHFSSQPFHTIFAYNGLSPSNNHLINSIMIKLSSFLLGTNEFSCRLPNLFAHLLYLLASFLIVDRFHNHWITLCGFVIMNVNPFLLDFFGLARGYGLGLGFMMCGMYSFLRSLDASSPDVKRSFLTSFYVALATLSNLTFLNIFFAVTGVLFCSNSIKLYLLERNVHRSSVERLLIFLRSLVPILSVYIMLATFIVLPIIKLQRVHDFYIGGKLGFWSDTVGTLIASSLYEQNYFGPGGTEYLAKIIWMIVFWCSPANTLK